MLSLQQTPTKISALDTRFGSPVQIPDKNLVPLKGTGIVFGNDDFNVVKSKIFDFLNQKATTDSEGHQASTLLTFYRKTDFEAMLATICMKSGVGFGFPKELEEVSHHCNVL